MTDKSSTRSRGGPAGILTTLSKEKMTITQTQAIITEAERGTLNIPNGENQGEEQDRRQSGLTWTVEISGAIKRWEPTFKLSANVAGERQLGGKGQHASLYPAALDNIHQGSGRKAAKTFYLTRSTLKQRLA